MANRKKKLFSYCVGKRGLLIHYVGNWLTCLKQIMHLLCKLRCFTSIFSPEESNNWTRVKLRFFLKRVWYRQTAADTTFAVRSLNEWQNVYISQSKVVCRIFLSAKAYYVFIINKLKHSCQQIWNFLSRDQALSHSLTVLTLDISSWTLEEKF